MAYSPKIDITAISESMRPIVAMWFSGYVEVWRPGGDGTFDRVTNTSAGNDPTKIWEGDARIQPLRSANKVVAGFQASELRGIRFQVNLDPTIQFIKGLKVVVVNGGEDPTLAEYDYVIESGINSSQAWQRTIEATVDLAGSR